MQQSFYLADDTGHSMRLGSLISRTALATRTD